MSKRVMATIVLIALISALVTGGLLAQAGGESGGVIRGGGTTIVEGGTGAPSFDPVITKFAFNWRSGGGHFECLALAANAPAGDPESGNFDTNVMYVTGEIESADVGGGVARFEGTATVTGLGAGENEPFTVRVTRGGPGATLVLRVSELTFREIVLEGQIAF